MSVTQHFQESEKKNAVAVLMQLKSGGILEWYNYIIMHYHYNNNIFKRLSLKGSKKVITSIRISDINFIIWGRAGMYHHQYHQNFHHHINRDQTTNS